ncbi:MAG: hypothetical protein CM15mP127_12970 [Gammaproteobacteria bacterium]|nr:MAG: hypothetical protein CM15mP127_12970 [Gammaproteobacteria bacterium]
MQLMIQSGKTFEVIYRMNKKLILIVDDEKDIRNIIRYNLKKKACAV